MKRKYFTIGIASSKTTTYTSISGPMPWLLNSQKADIDFTEQTYFCSLKFLTF